MNICLQKRLLSTGHNFVDIIPLMRLNLKLVQHIKWAKKDRPAVSLAPATANVQPGRTKQWIFQVHISHTFKNKLCPFCSSDHMAWIISVKHSSHHDLHWHYFLEVKWWGFTVRSFMDCSRSLFSFTYFAERWLYSSKLKTRVTRVFLLSGFLVEN